MASFFCSSVERFFLLGQFILATVATQAARNSRLTSGKLIFKSLVVVACTTGCGVLVTGSISELFTTVTFVGFCCCTAHDIKDKEASTIKARYLFTFSFIQNIIMHKNNKINEYLANF